MEIPEFNLVIDGERVQEIRFYPKEDANVRWYLRGEHLGWGHGRTFEEAVLHFASAKEDEED